MINPLVVVSDDRFSTLAKDVAPPRRKKSGMRKTIAAASLLGFAVGAAVVAGVLSTNTPTPDDVVVTQQVAALTGDAPSCGAINQVQYGTYERKGGRNCDAGDAMLEEHSPFRVCWHKWALLCKDKTCGRCFTGSVVEATTGRTYKHLALEAERRENAGTGLLLALVDVPNFEDSSNTNPFLQGNLFDSFVSIFTANSIAEFFDSLVATGTFSLVTTAIVSSNLMFPLTNFVDGFRAGDTDADKWNAPVQGEKVGLISYHDAAKQVLNTEFTEDYDYFKLYFTGSRIPSWEDNVEHSKAMGLLEKGMSAARAVGMDPISFLYGTEPRFAFDHEGLSSAAWNGFTYANARDIKYASNGVHGAAVVESYDEEDVLGPLMTDSVFGAHLTYDDIQDTYKLDLSKLERYTPLEGFAKMGGKAEFKLDSETNLLKTTKLEYFGDVYGAAEFADPAVREAYQKNRLIGWRFAEKAIIASLLSQTNLVIHVKDLHLELAAAFQAVSVDVFSANVEHPIGRLLQPYQHRAIQATNDNFKLLFEYKAAEFSLAPLPNSEQLRLIGDAIKEEPLRIEDLEMKNFAAKRNMPESASAAGTGFWRWHYRATTVQNLYEELINCHLDANYDDDAAIENDPLLKEWWTSLVTHLPALNRTVVDADDVPQFAGEKMTKTGLVNVLKTMFTWLSWVHEDVGHSAAAYVYNPVHTPMNVPADGVGIALKAFAFNAAAYRGFVFLERAKLLDPAPEFWFDAGAGDRKCYEGFQQSLTELGENDPAFYECDANGFYSCVDRVETGVSS